MKNGTVRKTSWKSNSLRKVHNLRKMGQWWLLSSKETKKLFLLKLPITRTHLIAYFRSSSSLLFGNPLASWEPSYPSDHPAVPSVDYTSLECGHPSSVLNSLLFLSPHHLSQCTHSLQKPSSQLSPEFPSSIFYSPQDSFSWKTCFQISLSIYLFISVCDTMPHAKYLHDNLLFSKAAHSKTVHQTWKTFFSLRTQLKAK